MLAGLARRRRPAAAPVVLRVQAGAMPEKPRSMLPFTVMLLLVTAGLLGLAMYL